MCWFARKHICQHTRSRVRVLPHLLQIEATDDFGADHVLHICNRFSNLTSLALSNVPNAINDTCVQRSLLSPPQVPGRMLHPRRFLLCWLSVCVKALSFRCADVAVSALLSDLLLLAID